MVTIKRQRDDHPTAAGAAAVAANAGTDRINGDAIPLG
jgi:hypothetical protein